VAKSTWNATRREVMGKFLLGHDGANHTRQARIILTGVAP
jgi:hypothetical protein